MSSATGYSLDVEAQPSYFDTMHYAAERAASIMQVAEYAGYFAVGVGLEMLRRRRLLTGGVLIAAGVVAAGKCHDVAYDLRQEATEFATLAYLQEEVAPISDEE